MKLDFDICKGGRVHNKKIIGMRYNHKDIYSLIGNYNAYTIEVTENGPKTINFDISDEYYYSEIDPYFDMGDGSKYYSNQLSYTYTEPGEYLIITSARIAGVIIRGTQPKVIAINGIRRDSISLEGAFSYCSKYPGETTYFSIKEFKPNNVNTKRVTNMKKAFYWCYYLTSLDLSDFNTSNVTDMSNMFYLCNELTSLDVSNFNTSKVIYMNGLFQHCELLTSIDVSNFDTSNVTDMSNMFFYCSSLTSLDLSNFDTSNVKDMSGMFAYCFNLPSIDVSNFDTSNVTDMTQMFNEYKGTELDLSNFDTSNVTDMDIMFAECRNLTSLDLSNFDTSNVTDMDRMFCNCELLTSLDLSNWDISNVTDMSYMFAGCTSLTTLLAPKNISSSLSLEDTHLNHDSLMSVINNLSTTSPDILILGDVLLSQLSTEEKQIALDKGWDLY